jgi:glycosyltransferase involved in cell wall biosynthesis
MTATPPPDVAARNPQRARLYQTLRTAHLERAVVLPPATIIYRDRRYDFDTELASRLDLVRTGTLGAARYLFWSDITEFEINEPLMRNSIRGSALALLALGARRRLRGKKALVVTYAIENLDPFARRAAGVRGRLSRAFDRTLSRYVWRHTDRIAYGTSAARDLYAEAFPPPRARVKHIVIPMLPEPCSCLDIGRVENRVVFLGALSERKGFPLVVAAWPLVAAKNPLASLVIMGKGALEAEAVALAGTTENVTVLIDPSRAEIHRQLRAANVVTLPSQPTSNWREQVGLPITEGLAHGASIVTTTQTGLAEWLREHGHEVIAPGGSAAELADAILRILGRSVSADEVLADLPARDGRLAAADWLFSD